MAKAKHKYSLMCNKAAMLGLSTPIMLFSLKAKIGKGLLNLFNTAQPSFLTSSNYPINELLYFVII